MAGRVFALLAGINAYPAAVPPLEGCLADIARMEGVLRAGFGDALALETLRDGEVTRANMLLLFRGHLGQAGPDDAVLLHYCGHGARSPAAPEFRPFFPDGFDEGLVCADSRTPGQHDLADKELAVLIGDLARTGAHVAVALDCCHSGSGTRDGLRVRLADPHPEPRDLASYLDGHYLAAGLTPPEPRHILLAACERGQTAKERPDHGGVFTGALAEALERTGCAVDYVELFRRCRALVLARADAQVPQFEPSGGFDARSGFLGRSIPRREPPFRVWFDNVWQVDCGALHDMPAPPAAPATFGLYALEDRDFATRLATATADVVAAQGSTVSIDPAPPGYAAKYWALRDGMPKPGFPVAVSGEMSLLPPDVPVDPVPGADYALDLAPGALRLSRADGLEIARLDTPAVMASVLRSVIRWERMRVLGNPGSAIDPSLLGLRWVDDVAPAGEGPDVARTLPPGGGLRGWVEARNASGQVLHLLLLYFSADFAIAELHNEPLAPSDSWQRIWGGGAEDVFYIPPGATSSRELFRLFVTTERADAFLVTQDPLDLPVRAASRDVAMATAAQALAREWRVLDLRLALRQDGGA